MAAANEHKRETRPHGDARRRKILDTAMELFAARGFNNVGLAEIASTVGISQPGLLHHFPTKADLLLAVLQEREERNDAEEKRYADEGHDFLEAFTRTLENNECNPVLVQLFALLSAESISTSNPSHDYWVQRYDHLINNAVAGLNGLVDEAALPPGVTTETIARWVFAMADGLRIQWLLRPDSMSRSLLVRQFVDILSPYLRRTKHDVTIEGPAQ